ncbi:MAG: hypothetical protein KAV82_03770 [Phycisphaerae bacterium]|nr:hypothetical protein [Phycisphaerae bacterium]
MIESMLLMSDSLALINLTAVYWICLVFGGGLVLISTLSGHGDAHHMDIGGHADVDGALHVDVDTDGAIHAELPGHADTDLPGDVHSTIETATFAVWLANWFSLRFVVFFVAVFGAIGVVLTHMTEMNSGAVLGIALAAGGAVGQGVHQVFRRLRRSSGDSTPQPTDYVHKLARVTIAIAHPNKGEVSLQVRGAQRYVPAVPGQPDTTFQLGEEVVVVGYRAGIAEVVSRDEYESLNR